MSRVVSILLVCLEEAVEAQVLAVAAPIPALAPVTTATRRTASGVVMRSL